MRKDLGIIYVWILALGASLILAGCGGDEPAVAADDTLPPTDGALGGGSADRPDFVSDTNVFSGDLPPERDPAFLQAGAFGPGATNGPAPIASVYFDFNDFSVGPSERNKLSPIVDYLRGNPGIRLVAEGHTDWHGTTEYNIGLSDRRASSVKQYLSQLGVDPARVEILAMGEIEAQQGAPKGSPTAAQDRRVDLLPVQ
ncbi:MAG: OmpA family protein [Opitutales bacterium]